MGRRKIVLIIIPGTGVNIIHCFHTIYSFKQSQVLIQCIKQQPTSSLIVNNAARSGKANTHEVGHIWCCSTKIIT